MVVAISLAYVTYGGLWWMQALFYAIGATVIAIIAIAAYKLAREYQQARSAALGHLRPPHRGHHLGPSRTGGIFYPGGAGGAAGAGVAGLETGAAHGTGWPRRGGSHLVARGLAPPCRNRRRFHGCPGADSAVFYQGRGVCLRQRAGHHSVFAPGGGPAIRLAERAPVPGRRRGGDDHPRPRGDHGRVHRLPRRRVGRGGHGRDRHLPARLRVYRCSPPPGSNATATIRS